MISFRHISGFKSQVFRRHFVKRECGTDTTATSRSTRVQVSMLALVLFCARALAADSGQAEYVLQPMDLVKIEVFQEPDMERQVRITQDSSITLPLINKVDL